MYTADNASFLNVNPKGNVPAIKLPCGALLNEGSATLQYVADLAPASGLAPANGTVARYQLQNVLSFLGTEVHASFGPLFGPGSDEFKAAQRAKVATKFTLLTEALGDKPFLMGAALTVADLYASVIISWSGYVGVDLAPFPKLAEYMARVKAVPAVAEAQKIMDAAA